MAEHEIKIKLNDEVSAELERVSELLSEARIRQIVREEIAANRATLLQSLMDEIRQRQGMMR